MPFKWHPIWLNQTSSSNPVCAGNTVLFTAHPIDEGSSPVYQWKVNGVNAGTNSSNFTYIPVNNDPVSCVLTSSLTSCVTNNPTTSNMVTMTVNPNYTLSETISAPSDTVCQRTSVQLTTHPANEGLTPVYQWKVNWVNTWVDLSIYSYTPVNNDVVWAVFLRLFILSAQRTTWPQPRPCRWPLSIILRQGYPFRPFPTRSVREARWTAQPYPPMVDLHLHTSGKWTGSMPGPMYPFILSFLFRGRSFSARWIPACPCITNKPITSNTIVMNDLAAPSVSFTLCFDSITTINAAAFKL